MSEKKLRFYFDENMPYEAVKQLRRHGIDALAAKDLDELGIGDPEQLQIAIRQGRVLCTYDRHFVDIAKLGIEHHGSAYFRGRIGDISRIARVLRSLHESESRESMKVRLEYLKPRRP